MVTVGELRKMLSKFSDDQPIILSENPFSEVGVRDFRAFNYGSSSIYLCNNSADGGKVNLQDYRLRAGDGSMDLNSMPGTRRLAFQAACESAMAIFDPVAKRAAELAVAGDESEFVENMRKGIFPIEIASRALDKSREAVAVYGDIPEDVREIIATAAVAEQEYWVPKCHGFQESED